MTVEDYWARVRSLGLRNPQRGHGSDNYVGTTRDGRVATIPDPTNLTPEQRELAADLLRARHGELH